MMQLCDPTNHTIVQAEGDKGCSQRHLSSDRPPTIDWCIISIY
jgi:hypothetical protein